MKPSISLRKALTDSQLLGDALAGDSWRSWRILMIAAMGEALTDDERVIFTKLTGREHEPNARVEEFAAVVGRRGGKSRAMATLACYIASLCKHDLVRGERGVLLIIAPDQRQAAIVLGYAEAAFEQSPILRQLIANPIERHDHADQRHLNRSSRIILQASTRANLHRRHRRRGRVLVHRRVLRECRCRNFQRSATGPRHDRRPVDHRQLALRQARRAVRTFTAGTTAITAIR